jgi:hypothetical protein
LEGERRVKRSTVTILTAGAFGIATVAWPGDRYNFAVRWPAKVQREVVGATLASPDTLLSRERHFAYGEGFARWRYKVDPRAPAFERFCGKTANVSCSFTRTRKVKEGVALSVSLSAGTLTIEEWWS